MNAESLTPIYDQLRREQFEAFLTEGFKPRWWYAAGITAALLFAIAITLIGASW